MTKKLTSKSRFLSYLLRHHPEKANLTMDEFGWVSIDELIQNTKLTHQEILTIVDTDEKKRYSISDDKQMIRANQGHSINVDPEFTRKDPPTYLYHGTPQKFLDKIQKEGLKKMDRHHVHLSSDEQTAIAVGKRRGKPAVIEIDAEKMQQDGIEFFISANGVWLVEYVDPLYFIRVII